LDKLGAKMLIASFSIKGDFSDESVCFKLVENIIENIGMTKAPGASACKYPVNGKGGIGYTFFQPIVESFVCVDAWPEFGGAYLVICSCKLFWLADVIKAINAMNFEIEQAKTQDLWLDNGF
jgi:S-adenosylmethionine/arginine decarboxylase-like enzyme